MPESGRLLREAGGGLLRGTRQVLHCLVSKPARVSVLGAMLLAPISAQTAWAQEKAEQKVDQKIEQEKVEQKVEDKIGAKNDTKNDTNDIKAEPKTEQKIALVIGNSAYRKVVQLPNPVNDAADMAASLTRLGFTVKHLTDLDYNAFRLALIDFGNAAKTADKAVLFFAGHGVEIDGRNWLIPVDAQIKSEVDVYAEAINLETLIDISLLPKVIGLVILDACRNDPFAVAKLAAQRSPIDGKPGTKNASKASRDVTAARPDSAGSKASDNVATAASRGLAPVDVNDNVLVAFSAAAGTTANDGTGRNSPYSGSLVRHVETPGLEINYLFRMVHDDVVAETRTQQPAIYGTLSNDEVYLKGDAAVAAAAAEAEAERVAWTFVRGTNEVATLRRFQEQFPASPHAAEAGDRIAQLQGAEKFAWTLVGQQRSAAAYRAFLDLYPRGEFVEQARTTLASLDSSRGGRQASSKDGAKPVDLPKPPVSAYQLDTASPDATTKNAESIEKVWAMLRDSPDQKVAGRFAEKYPSMRHHRLPPGSDMALRRADPTELMLRTAQDEDVNGCFGGNAAACAKAAAKYPDYVQLQFQRCRILEDRDVNDRVSRNRGRCMADAVREARRRGYLVSAYTRSAREVERNRAYRKTVERVNQNVGNIVGNVVSNVVSTTVSTTVSNAVSAASQAAAAAAANAASAAAASAASHAASRAAAHAASTAASSAASRAASTAASNAASRAASNAAGRAASGAASRAASGAADRAAKKAAEAAAAAAANAASNIRVPSDRRLKRDIVLLGHTAGGLQLYRYRYIGDSTVYVGVMAQEVAVHMPAAVSQADSGYLQVDYGRLGIAFLTWRDWIKRSSSHAMN